MKIIPCQLRSYVSITLVFASLSLDPFQTAFVKCSREHDPEFPSGAPDSGDGITACTVVQAVVKTTSQSNGKGQILTPWRSKTPERISMKLGIYNRAADMTTQANPRGAATTWVVWANT